MRIQLRRLVAVLYDPRAGIRHEPLLQSAGRKRLAPLSRQAVAAGSASGVPKDEKADNGKQHRNSDSGTVSERIVECRIFHRAAEYHALPKRDSSKGTETDQHA